MNDLELCTYSGDPKIHGNWAVPLLAIGWLEAGHNFETGPVEQGVVDKVRKLHEQTWQKFIAFSYRGLHECDLCASGSATRGIDGSHTNTFVPGDNCVYMASGGILHYIEKHSYLPPLEFIDAVRDSPLPSTQEYAEALIEANQGERPLLLGPMTT
ncbi:MAG: hypothetical protein AAF585_04945 [Verrucomicrobiota bacterium]